MKFKKKDMKADCQVEMTGISRVRSGAVFSPRQPQLQYFMRRNVCPLCHRIAGGCGEEEAEVEGRTAILPVAR